ncbi:2,3-diaminopropionate biosynthesis protein SbnA [Pseudomonas fontis]|uniref:cysteine synthase n=1 Tax=Pseudomonas fontis TaxID=2942633 RepID=A0ABT5NY50_9PSED|nr:2,3-diaminopropionate biosynthesis protein SbnA [Pseudomonas fontis]MDD0972510.1 2,3-diaminopropionate biosynthesis protein SbnA [Pseudomonas fontis]MDD0993034.1 2,3-diaminopropionate biosynthesis protein SbnA [Pseudomonas fontis]
MVISSPGDLVFDDVFLELREVLEDTPVFVKLEGFSLSGSIKVKSALRMVERLELEGRLSPGNALIESSSGNLGLALAMVCASKGYPFICVSDPNISPQTAKLIEAYGARLMLVNQRDRNGGFLGSRIELIERLLDEDPQLVWTNQYGNINNVEAHYLSTAPAILRQFAQPDYVFVGAGTTGTLGGVSRYLRQHSPRTRIVAVDSVGSVTFGQPSGPRHIPGLGTSQAPAIREYSRYDQLLMVPEAQALHMCHSLARRGILLGGSSGTVLAGVRQLAQQIEPGACVVAIAPDLGDRYVDTVYNPEWVTRHYPDFYSTAPSRPAAIAV